MIGQDNRKTYLITTIVAICMIAVICVIQGIFEAEDLQMVIRRLSDGCFITGVLLAGIGLIIYALNEGVFNGIAFGLKTLGRTFSARKDEKIREEDFYEYNKRMMEKRKSFRHLVIVGAVAIVVSVVLAFIHELI